MAAKEPAVCCSASDLLILHVPKRVCKLQTGIDYHAHGEIYFEGDNKWYKGVLMKRHIKFALDFKYDVDGSVSKDKFA